MYRARGTQAQKRDREWGGGGGGRGGLWGGGGGGGLRERGLFYIDVLPSK